MRENNETRKVMFAPYQKNGSIILGENVRITDPCYSPDTWCAANISILPGEYECLYQNYESEDPEFGKDQRIASIIIRHKDYPDIFCDERLDADIGVDSGQCGFFDAEYYENQYEAEESREKFYDKVCEHTEKRGIIDNPKYVPFEKSSFYQEKFEKFSTYSFDKRLIRSFDYSKSLEKAATLMANEKLNGNMQKMNEIEKDFKEMQKAFFQYCDSDEARKQTYGFLNIADVMEDKGYVSSSGFGDGSYNCYVGRNEAGEVVGLELEFIPEHEYEEEVELDLEEMEENPEKE